LQPSQLSISRSALCIVERSKYHNLFLGRWIKKVAHGARSLAPGHDGCTRIHFNGPAGVNEDDVRELLSITNEKNHNNTYRCDDS